MMRFGHSALMGALLLAGLVLASGAAVAASNTFTYQGVLRDSGGNPPPDAARAMSFALFTVPTLGAAIWTESHPAVPSTGGAFSVELGLLTPLGAIFQNNPILYLEVSADLGSGLTAYAPRVALSGAPYAHYALNADKLDGVDAAELEESAEIIAAVTGHNTNANAHANINLDGARITSGKIANARLNTGSGQGLDADTVDGFHGADLEESAEIVAAVATHDADGAAHADIRAEIDADVTAHNTNPAAHANINLDGARITSGKISNDRLNMGVGGGIDADLLDGQHASAFATPAGVTSTVDAALLVHNADAAAHPALQMPPGVLMPYAGSAAPTGWLLCNGAAVSRTTHAALFAIIGTTYGAGDGSTTFNLPDLRGRGVIGLDNMGGTPANRVTAAQADILGGTAGAETHTLTAAEMPAHSHGVNDPGHAHTYQHHIDEGLQFLSALNQSDMGHWLGNFATAGSTTGISIQNTGGGQAHNNMAPYMAMNYIIKR